MARRLTAHERALWSRVAATVRPLGGAPPVIPLPPVATVSIKPAVRTQSAPAPRPLIAARNLPTPVAAATLDGGWDRRLRQGDIRPDRIVDLHGHSLAAAHDVLATALEDAAARGDRIILIVTGKGRSDRPGRIKAELDHWLDSGSHRRQIAALRPAHPRHGGDGAFYLILRRRP